jgi:hypothetical protein
MNEAKATQRDSEIARDATQLNPAATRKFCRSCVHYRMRSPMRLFSGAELSAPGVLKAQNQWDQQRSQRAFQEEQRLLSQLPFDYEPHHYPWCAHFSREDTAKNALKGNTAALQELIAEGLVSINPVTGDINPLYILCAWKNQHEDCTEFKHRQDS